MMRKLLNVGVAALVMASATAFTPAQATTTITYASNGSGAASEAVGSNTVFIGDNFTASSGYDVLNDFTYTATYNYSIKYRAYIYQVSSNGTIIGNSIYTSNVITATSSVLFTNVGTVSLVDGNTYAALLSGNGLGDSVYNPLQQSTSNYNGDVYNSSTPPTSGMTRSDSNSYAFTVHFNNASAVAVPGANDTSVPEPGFMIGLLGLGFLGLVAARRIRQPVNLEA